jgi:hypothetical protein
VFPIKLLFLYLLIIFSCVFVQAQKGRIAKIIDGDTYLVQTLVSNEIIKVRLWIETEPVEPRVWRKRHLQSLSSSA